MTAAAGSPSERRRAIARLITNHLAANTDLRASLLTGSAAAGISDDDSDIDLLNYYDRLPAKPEFDRLIAVVGGQPRADIASTEEGFSAGYRLDGIEVQTGAQLTIAVERRLDQIAAGDVDWITAKVAMGLLEGMPLHGAQLLRAWQARAAYPESLRRREIESNLGFFPIWKVDPQLAARDAELFRRQMLLDGAFKVMAVLSAVNRMYFTTFQFKRSHTHAEKMTLKPDRLADRLNLIANARPSEAAAELEQLIEETKAIVRTELPDLETDVAWSPLAKS